MRVFLLFLMLGSTMFSFAEDGVPAVITKKCVKCHFVTSHGIETTKKDPSKAKDLSNTGNIMPDAGALRSYLKKESLWNDKKHKTSFKGSDEEFDKLIEWLLSLKEENPKE